MDYREFEGLLKGYIIGYHNALGITPGMRDKSLARQLTVLSTYRSLDAGDVNALLDTNLWTTLVGVESFRFRVYRRLAKLLRFLLRV